MFQSGPGKENNMCNGSEVKFTVIFKTATYSMMNKRDGEYQKSSQKGREYTSSKGHVT